MPRRAHGLFRELEADPEVLDIERRTVRLEKTYLQIVTRWSLSIDSLDRTPPAMPRGWPTWPAGWGRRWGSRTADLTALRVAGLLHDLGKTALPPTS